MRRSTGRKSLVSEKYDSASEPGTPGRTADEAGAEGATQAAATPGLAWLAAEMAPHPPPPMPAGPLPSQLSRAGLNSIEVKSTLK